MNIFYSLLLLFFISGFIGWISELFFNRIAFKKWINPGFFVGPILPIYGLGLMIATLIVYYIENQNYAYPAVLSILSICILMTLMELIAGLLFKKMGIMIWDYSDYFLNYKGVICPLYSFLWLVAGMVFYFFFSAKFLDLLQYFLIHSELYLYTGIFLGMFILDFVYSFGLLFRLRRYSKNNNVEINFEDFKKYIKENQEKRREKYSFIFAFKQNISLEEHLKEYKERRKNNN